MRVRSFLGMWAVLICAAGLTMVVSNRLDVGGSAGDQVVSGTTGGTATPAPSSVATPGQVRVQGEVTAMRLEGATLKPRGIATPLTVTSERGFGNGGELTFVTVDGERSSIVWDGGRPFVLSEGGSLLPERVVTDLTPDGIRLALGGSTHALQPGTYRLNTPVAVGSSGVATPHDMVTFQATDRSRFEARGDAATVLGPTAAHELIGRGRVELTGSLELTDASGIRTTKSLAVDRSAFDLTFTPTAGGGWIVQGVVDSSPIP